jgi:hypothetical protein
VSDFYAPDSDWECRCVCGDLVAVPHKECMALLTKRQRQAFLRGRQWGVPEAVES